MSHHESPDAMTLAMLSLVDLDVVCGGEATSPATSQQTTTVNPNLSCPPGTSPRFEHTTTTSGGYLWGLIGGSTKTTTTFSCDPAAQPAPSSSG